MNLAYSLVIDNYDIIGHNSDLDKNILYLEILNETNESILWFEEDFETKKKHLLKWLPIINVAQ